MKINSSEFQKLCIKKLSDNIADHEIKFFNDLIERSEKHKSEYLELKQLWQNLSINKLDYLIDIDEDWKKVDSAISVPSTNIKKNIRSSLKFIHSFQGRILKPAIALGITIMLIIMSILYFDNLSDGQLKEIITRDNQKIDIKLSDGSKVSLNYGSKISFLEDFGDSERIVYLQGEAFFSIINDGRPFEVFTSNATARVLGTMFNVWSRNNETRVIVKEGRIRLTGNKGEAEEVILTKGEASSLIDSGVPTKVVKVNVDLAIGWLEGKIVFDNTSLDEAIDELRRYYNEQILIEPSELRNYRLTGTFYNEEIDSVLSKLCLALNLNYEQSNERYTIFK